MLIDWQLESLVENSDMGKDAVIHVLLVDDEAGFLKSVKKILELHNSVQVDSACSVEEALETVGKTEFDVIVSDYQMPLKNGLQFLNELRNSGNNTPFIMFTGKGREEIAIKALNLGADYYITKSGKPEIIYAELRHAIMRVVSRRRMEETLEIERKKLETVTKNMTAGLMLVSRDFQILWVNNVLKTAVGEPFKGKLCYKLINQLNSPCSGCGVREIFEKEKDVVVHEQLVKGFDGQDIWLEITATPIRDNKGNIIAALELANNITDRKKVEGKLRASEEKYKVLVKNSAQAILVYQGHSFKFINGKVEQITGYSEDELLSMNIIDLIHQKDRKRVTQLTKEFMQSTLTEKENLPTRTFRIVTKNGKTKWVTLKSVSIMWEEKPARLYFASDITELKLIQQKLVKQQKNLEKLVSKRTEEMRIKQEKLVASNWALIEAKRTLEASMNVLAENEREMNIIFENSLLGLAYINSEGIITRANSVFSKITGILSDKIIGFNVLKDPMNVDFIKASEKSLQGKVAVYEGESVRAKKKGIRKVIKYVFNPINPGKISAQILTNLDNIEIDSSASQKHEIRKVIKYVFNPINPGKISTPVLLSLEDVTENRDLENMKNQFMNTVTHELRTPLVSIKGYIELLLADSTISNQEKIIEKLKIIERNSDRLIELTSELMDIRRLDSGKMILNFQEIDLLSNIEYCAMEIRPFMETKKQQFSVILPEKPLKIYGDEMRLCHVFSNILNNASKFTAEEGKITLSVNEKDDVFQISITDTGIGIRQEDIPKVFTPFVEIEKPGYLSGMGLGLGVARGVVEMHGGKIWVESDGPDKGSKFFVELPKYKKEGYENAE